MNDVRKTILIWSKELDHLGEDNELWKDISKILEKHKEKYSSGFVSGLDHKTHIVGKETIHIKVIPYK